MKGGGLRISVLSDAKVAERIALHRDDHPVKPGDEWFDDSLDAAPVARALEAHGHRVTLCALDRTVKGLGPLTAANTDLAFNLCDTLDGESRLGPLVPALLEAKHIRVVGADQFGLALSKRKHDVKAVLEREGLPTPRYQVITTSKAPFSLALEPPVIVKLTAEHSSIGIEAASVCFSEAETVERAKAMLRRFRQPVLVEEYVGGRELYVSLYGHPLKPLPMMEHSFADLPAGVPPIRSFDVKWFSDTTKAAPKAKTPDPRWSKPVPVREPTMLWRGDLEDIPELCRRALDVVGGRDWGRVDLRIDKGGVPLIIDVTPNTYLGSSGPCAKAAASAGLSYDSFVAAIASGARKRG